MLSDEFYEGVVIRPPSEADSLILQVTLGCTDNGCIFCPAYKEKTFSIKPFERIEREMRQAARIFPEARKIFLADGDAIVMPQEMLVTILDLASSCFPLLTRVGVYGSIKSLQSKTVAELAALKEKKLGIIYLGFETGDEEVYRRIRKFGSPQGNIETCRKVKEAGIKTNVTVILGLGGKDLSHQHAVHTAEILNVAQPHQIAALTLMIAPGTPLETMLREGSFVPLTDFEILAELRELVAHMADFKCLFFANHASNYYPIQARFPRDRVAVLEELDRIIGEQRKDRLTPDHLRGL